MTCLSRPAQRIRSMPPRPFRVPRRSRNAFLTCCATSRTPPRPTPAAIWPVQAQRALRGLIRAWHDARDAGLTAVPAKAADPLIVEFRRAVRAGLASVPRIPGPKTPPPQHPWRDLLEFCS